MILDLQEKLRSTELKKYEATKFIDDLLSGDYA